MFSPGGEDSADFPGAHLGDALGGEGFKVQVWRVDLAAVVEFYNEDGEGPPGTAELVAVIFKVLGDTDQAH